MNLKDNNMKIENSVNGNKNVDSFKPQNQRDNFKLLIMEKYNLNSNEAEKILLKIENKNNTDSSQSKISNNLQIKNNQNQNTLHSSKIQVKQNVIFNRDDDNLEDKSFITSGGHVKSKNVTKSQNIGMKKQLDNKNDKLTFEKQYYIKNDEHVIDNSNSQKTQHIENVDSLLGNILPDYNKQASIIVNHVDLTFEVQNEKVDTIKETFIRTITRTKSKKIKIHALKDISFKIYKGEKVGIIGFNGAGKSTLLNVITGIYPPDKGKVITEGNISPLLSLGAGFDYNFSGRKNIILNGAVLGYDKEFLESKVDEIIEFSELGEFIDIPIKNYSSGMLAKLGFSIATAVEPDILIIDEILGVGDVNFQKKSKDKIRSLMDCGTTVLLVSHSIPQVRELCDKAIWIDNGYLREMGEVNKVCDNYLKDSEKASNEQLQNIQLR